MFGIVLWDDIWMVLKYKGCYAYKEMMTMVVPMVRWMMLERRMKIIFFLMVMSFVVV